MPPKAETVPAMPPPSPPPPSRSFTGKKFTNYEHVAVISGIIVAVALITGLYLIGVPIIKGPSSHGAAAMVLPSPSITMMVPTTIYPTAAPQTFVVRRADQYEATYVEIYTSNRSYKFGEKEVFFHDLVRPPLYIRFIVTPGMVTREKIVDIGTSSEHNVTAVYVNPNSWFEVTVSDTGTGIVVDKRGFNKDYSQIAKQEFMVRTTGNYRIDMSGNDVSVYAEILSGM
jgi:hypothetical protein